MHRSVSVHSQSTTSEDSDRDYVYGQDDAYPDGRSGFRPPNDDHCIRCGVRVYPIERVEVGIPLHKNCFRCRECNVILSLHNFILARLDDERKEKDVFCKAHAPKPDKNRLDPEAIGIKSAVHSQQLSKTASFNSQIRVSADMAGWEYDPKAIEFEHAKILHERNKFKRPPSHDIEPDDIEYEKGELIRKLRHGEIRKEKVKEVAHTMADVLNKALHPKKVPETKFNSYEVTGYDVRYQRDNGRKFPLDSEYMKPNALWSPDNVGDPWNPKYLDSNKAEEDESLFFDSSNSQCEEIYGDLPGSLVFDPNLGDDRRSPARTEGDEQCPLTESIYEKLNVLRPTDGTASTPSGGQNGDGQREKMRSQDEWWTPANGLTVRSAAARRQCYENTQPHQCPTIRGRTGLTPRKTPPEYLKEKKFVEQNQLELRQRHEHDEMIRELERARGSQIQHLEEEAKRQAEDALNDLFSRLKNGTFRGDINSAKLRIEQRFRRMREEKMKYVMSNLTGQERMRIDDMINKQTQEMLELIDQKVSTNLPPPQPPKTKKVTLYSSPDIFDEVDFYAIQVAQYETESFTELVFELTKHCRNVLEKTRAIFKWLTYKDLNLMMFSEELTEDSPYYFLKGIKYGLESYHELFKRLCSYAGIPVKIIRGLSKSAGYRPGMTFEGDDRFRNSWAVVYIDDSWRFVDCHWGARHISNPDQFDNPCCFCYELDEFYFLTDPEDIIYMHYPDDPEWQLLERPIDLEQFVHLPVFKSHFFHYRIKMKTELTSSVEVSTGKLEVAMAYSERFHLAFNSRLEYEGEELNGYSIHHYVHNQVFFNINLPQTGVYYLTIFACDKSRSDTYNNICSFRIQCVGIEPVPLVRFPALPDGYGLTAVGVDLGLAAEKFDKYYIVCNDDRMILNIKFSCPVMVSQKLARGTPDGRVVQTVYCQGKKIDLDRMAFQRYKDPCFVSYILRFAEPAIYVFSVFAGYSESSSPVLDCACRYLIQCNNTNQTLIRTYPKTLQYWRRCRLHEPTSGELRLNRNIRFKLEVLRAEAVAVIVGRHWFYLKRDETGKIWEGVAHTGKDLKQTAEVYARYSTSDKDFYPLLEYRLVKEE